MRCFVIPAFAVLSLATLACAGPRPIPREPVTDPGDPDIQLLTALQLKIAASIAPLDSAALDSIIAPDARMIDAGDHVLHKADIVPAIRSIGPALVRVTDDSIAVRRYGDVAIMTVREVVSMRTDTGIVTGTLRITEFWLRRGGRWQAVGGQSTALP